MVYTEPELVLRQQQFHVALAMPQPKSDIGTPLLWILKIPTVKGYSHSFRITRDVYTEPAREQRIALYKLINVMNHNNTAELSKPDD